MTHHIECSLIGVVEKRIKTRGGGIEFGGRRNVKEGRGENLK